MSLKTAEQALYEDLLSIYARAGAEVTYETDKGQIKPYWAKRFLQAVKRSEKNDELFEFVDRLLRAGEPSRGFLILKKANRLDLTVETLVLDSEKPYYGEIDFAVVQAARRRLADHGYTAAFDSSGVPAPDPIENGAAVRRAAAIELSPGTSVDVRVTVAADGSLSLALV